MATENLFAPPPKYNLPLSKGSDLAVEFLNDPNNNEVYVDYSPGVTLTLVIEESPPISQAAVISGHTATVKIESDITDTIDNEVAWRLVVSSPTSPTTEVVAANGKTKRFDG